jgi:hypothetical protein
MPQQEQEVSEGINRKGQIFSPSHLIGFDQQLFWLYSQMVYLYNKRLTSDISSDFITKKFSFLCVGHDFQVRHPHSVFTNQ